MGLIFESSLLGASVKVFADRVEVKNGFAGATELIPIGQIASVKVGSWAANRVSVETTGGREYTITTTKKQEVANAISQAQMMLRAQAQMSTPSFAPPASFSVADELSKLAQLHSQGVISTADFEQQKARLLGGSAHQQAQRPFQTPQPQPQPHFAYQPPFRPAPAKKPNTTLTVLKWVGIGIGGLLVFLVILGIAVGPSPKDVPSPQPASPDTATVAPSSSTLQTPIDPKNDVLTVDEKAFIAASFPYLEATNSQDRVLANVMVQAQNHQATLEDIHQSLQDTKTTEQSSFEAYHTSKVPKIFVPAAKKIDECKRLHDVAFKQLLAFWTDSNTAHIEEGSSTLKAAVVATNDAIETSRAVLASIASQRKKR